MNRPTLEGLTEDKLGMKPYEFARAVNLPMYTLKRYWNNNRLALNLLISGYEREVMGR